MSRCQPAAKEPSLRERPRKFVALGEGIELICRGPACLRIVQEQKCQAAHIQTMSERECVTQGTCILDASSYHSRGLVGEPKSPEFHRLNSSAAMTANRARQKYAM